MELEFFGAAGEVTGSCHIIRVNGKQLLLDCGMIQGRRKDEARNRDPFPFDAENIDAVVLSHAHIDHSGRLPLLVKRGFTGPIHTHNASKDLCGILLEDSASLSERDAERTNRRRERRGKPPVEPLYAVADARQVLKQLTGYRYRQVFEVLPGVKVRFQDAGHIIGSCIVEVWLEENGEQRKLVFSGDIGQYDTPILQDPAVVEEADLLIMESTYGGRVHRNRELTYQELGEVISDAHAGQGNILIPAFAIGRSQDVLYAMGRHYEEWRMDRWHVFLDSPMAIEASQVYWDYPHLYDDEATKFRKGIHDMPSLDNLHLTRSSAESMVINRVKSGAIVIAGSGMCNGGRIRHHLKHNLWRPECHVIFTGYQAYGSLGRKIVDGAKTVKIAGQSVQVKAHCHTIGGLSAHADENDLCRWVSGFSNTPDIYLVHGETRAANDLAHALERKFKTNVTVADSGLTVPLS
ncbi:MAG: MBL fold metallo-hydrolase [Pseudomonadota bacterium]